MVPDPEEPKPEPQKTIVDDISISEAKQGYEPKLENLFQYHGPT